VSRSEASAYSVRSASIADAAACAEIYAPYVRATTISLEDEPPSVPEMAARIRSALERHAWLVLEDGAGRVVGYAAAGAWRARAGYRHTCEVSAYVETGRSRTGVGRALYEALFSVLAERGFRTAVAVMTEPNDASTGLHLALHFRHAGTVQRAGFKHDQWLDVTHFQRSLDPDDGPVSD
jgi:phosphinothricin acetyltransferase